MMKCGDKTLNECLETLVQLENRISELRKSKLQRLLRMEGNSKKGTNCPENGTMYYLTVGDL